MKGWFDAFRSDGGPTLYSYSNRTPVTGDVHLVIVFVIFGTLFTAFLVIFPGIRKERLSTFLTVTLSLFVGATIQVAQYGSSWHTSSATIVSPYSAFSKHRTSAEIGGYIGLMHINITYRLLPVNGNVDEDVEYNERFWWRGSGEMTSSFKEALYQGAPFPIVSLAEYFSLHQEGFSWGSRYREAGYYASIMLWSSFASWCMMNLLLMVVPRYGAYGMVFTGTCMLLTNLLYWSLLPCEPLIAHIDGSILAFNLGWNYWLVLLAGVGCSLAGVIISAIDMIFPHQFSTILEVDYDTPYDRHVIIEESFDTRNVRRLPKIEDSFGDRIMRRADNYERLLLRILLLLHSYFLWEIRRSNCQYGAVNLSSQLSSKLQTRPESSADYSQGVINRGYASHEPSEFHQGNEVPGKNWSYPFPPAPRRTNP